MPGAARTRFQFKDRTPTIFIVVMALLFANLALSFGTDFWVKQFAPKHPTGSSLFRVQLKPDAIGFVPRWCLGTRIRACGYIL
jgi:hypothetical protein